MKKLILVLAMVLTCNSAWASIEYFDFTGLYAERIDTVGYTPSNVAGYIGGPVANNSLGYAQQFTLKDPTFIGHIITDINTYNTSIDGNGYINFSWIIYGNTVQNLNKPIPDINSQLKSENFNLAYHSFNNEFFDDQYSADIDFPIDPGIYWLAYERGIGEGSQTISFLSDKKFTASMPEPWTLVLLGSGLIGTILKKKIK